MGWLRTIEETFVATRLGIGYKECCNGYMGRLSEDQIYTVPSD